MRILFYNLLEHLRLERLKKDGKLSIIDKLTVIGS